jgi:hypothetical protein
MGKKFKFQSFKQWTKNLIQSLEKYLLIFLQHSIVILAPLPSCNVQVNIVSLLFNGLHFWWWANVCYHKTLMNSLWAFWESGEQPWWKHLGVKKWLNLKPSCKGDPIHMRFSSNCQCMVKMTHNFTFIQRMV